MEIVAIFLKHFLQSETAIKHCGCWKNSQYAAHRMQRVVLRVILKSLQINRKNDRFFKPTQSEFGTTKSLLFH